jgi:ureidoacrylate peracid hydrolase
MWPNPDPKKTALVVIDMNNGLVHPKGWYATHGVDISHMRKTIPNIKTMMQAAREVGIPIIFVLSRWRDERDGHGAFIKARPFVREIDSEGHYSIGTADFGWQGDLVDDLKLEKGDWTVIKTRVSCFHGTNMNYLLQGLSVDTLLLTGVLTNMCVETSARDSSQYGYKTIVLSDCVGTHTYLDLHEYSLKAIQYGFGDVTTSDAIIHELREACRKQDTA